MQYINILIETMEETKEVVHKYEEGSAAVVAQEDKNKHEIIIEQVRKTKKNEPKIFPFIVMIDKQAFSDMMDSQTSILKQFWVQQSNKFIIARKAKT